MNRPDPETALRFYYTQTEINSAEIKSLFNCCASTASRLKKQVLDEMTKRGVKTWLPGNVDIVTAYDVWKIDVERMEKQLIKLQKLRRAGVINDDTAAAKETTA